MVDDDSARWVAALGGPHGIEHERAVADLHALLLGVARAECARRAGQSGVRGVELDDVAQQAADDAVVGVVAKVTTFRGDSRFTTWAVSFVVLEVSAALGRHAWRRAGVAWDPPTWEALPERLGVSPEDVAVGAELVSVVRRAVEEVLTPHQRRVFTAVVVGGTPVDAVAADLATTRGAVYKAVFDARASLRRALVAAGHLPEQAGARGGGTGQNVTRGRRVPRARAGAAGGRA